VSLSSGPPCRLLTPPAVGRLALRNNAEEQLELAQQDLQQAELSRTRKYCETGPLR
jgi:hypothetical protein